jgi:hypothetical protein
MSMKKEEEHIYATHQKNSRYNINCGHVFLYFSGIDIDIFACLYKIKLFPITIFVYEFLILHNTIYIKGII